MLEIIVASRWKTTFPGAHLGMLAVENVDNRQHSNALEAYKTTLVERLRAQYDGFDRAALNEMPALAAYKKYYRKFGSTYHVLLQLESLLFKGRALPQVSPLVDATFAAEMETLLLTASHDLDRLELPITIDVSDGSEEFAQMGGGTRVLKANDMIMRDRDNVVCSVIYGQDDHSPVTPATRRALFVSYVPAGIEASVVEAHLQALEDNVRRFAPQAVFPYRQVHSAGV